MDYDISVWAVKWLEKDIDFLILIGLSQSCFNNNNNNNNNK